MIVNNHFQRELKGSKEFQDENARMIIVSNIKAVDKVKSPLTRTGTFVKLLK